MKKANHLLFGILLIGASTLTGCKKSGCTNNDATNYSSDSKKDDGSCKYESRAVFWYGGATADSLMTDGATSLTFYVDGKIAGSTATSVYWTAAPDCGANSSITITKDLGSVTTQSYTYSIKDQTGFEYFSGILNFNANTCVATELTW